MARSSHGASRASASRTQLAVFAVAAAVVLVDQLTKWWASERLSNGRMIDIVWTLRLQLVHNAGSAFSVGRGLGPFIGAFAVVIVLVLIRLGRMSQSKPMSIALGLVLGGACGNLVDRLVRDGSGSFLGGYVVDFVDFQWWPVFNVADMAIVCGAIALAWFSTTMQTPAALPDPSPNETSNTAMPHDASNDHDVSA